MNFVTFLSIVSIFSTSLLGAALKAEGRCVGEFKTDPLVTVSTSRGDVIGFRADHGNDKRKFYYGAGDVFLGIPFAQPPVGDLRFKVSSLQDSRISLSRRSLFRSRKNSIALYLRPTMRRTRVPRVPRMVTSISVRIVSISTSTHLRYSDDQLLERHNSC